MLLPKNTLTNLLQLIFICFIFNHTLLAQNDSIQLDFLLNKATEKEQLFECSNMMNDGYFYQADLICDKLLEKNPTSGNYAFRKGYLAIELRNDFETAIPYLERAVIETSKVWDQYSIEEVRAPIDAIFILAKCYHLNLELDKAEEYFKKFLEMSSKQSANVLSTAIYLQQIEVARKELAAPKPAFIKNIGREVNTSKPEYSPVISLDGSAIYFTSRRQWDENKSTDFVDPRLNKHPEDIYTSFHEADDSWTFPNRLNFCDAAQNEATMAISPDERRIYFYQDTKGNGDIFFSNVTNEIFKTISHVENKKINTKEWETHCTVTPDGKTMYFVSNKDGGYGMRDIYRAEKLENGEWGDPVNCGPTINSKYDEESPFIAINNRILYFSSNGEKSMGGFDIFQTVLDSTDKWTQPVNLGSPFNSTGDDLFYTTTFDGLTGYLTSTRKEGFGQNDIYEVKNNYLGIYPLAVLKGNIRLRDGAKMPEDIAVELVCKSCSKEPSRLIFPRFRDGFFLTDLALCTEYEAVYTSDNGKNIIYREVFKTNCEFKQEEIYQEVWLDAKKTQISKLYFIDGIIKDSQSKANIADVTVELKDINTGEIYFSGTSNEDGFFISDSLFLKQMNDKAQLRLSLQKVGYAPNTIDATLVFLDKSIIHLNELMNPFLTSLEPGFDLGIAINPIYFDYTKWNIRPDAAIELDKIVKILKENPSIKIELGSHTDARGTWQENSTLSKNRAKSSVDYIVSKGISRKRITGRGFGESKLKVSNEEIANTPKWVVQEELHQKNRRTEFIIVR